MWSNIYHKIFIIEYWIYQRKDTVIGLSFRLLGKSKLAPLWF